MTLPHALYSCERRNPGPQAHRSRLWAPAFAGALAVLTSGCAVSIASPTVVPAPAATAIPNAEPPLGIRYLFGSAEAGVTTQQTYGALLRFAAAAAQTRPGDSVVLAPDATPAAPRFVACGRKPMAVVFDADETLIWNVGAMRWFAEHGIGFDAKVWGQWERTGAGRAVAMPGAVAAVEALRAAGITVIANTNRQAANAAGTVATLKTAGLGDFVHGETLYLLGDDATGSSKDGRRATVAARYCVIAMVGDQLGDFAQAFNDKALSGPARKALATTGPIARLWGAGWFLLPNPLYGPWDKAPAADVYPPGSEWAPEANTP